MILPDKLFFKTTFSDVIYSLKRVALYTWKCEWVDKLPGSHYYSNDDVEYQFNTKRWIRVDKRFQEHKARLMNEPA